MDPFVFVKQKTVRRQDILVVITLTNDEIAPLINFSLMQKTHLIAFVHSKLDYCESRFYGSRMYVLQRIQKIENSAARLINQCR